MRELSQDTGFAQELAHSEQWKRRNLYMAAKMPLRNYNVLTIYYLNYPETTLWSPWINYL